MNGLLLLDKPAGMSSNSALQKARKLFGKAKAGHLGTLDPLASGLLPIAFGDATKFAQFGIAQDKSYLVTFTFGESTTTGDREGDIIATGDVFEGDVAPLFEQFIGGYEQQVPAFSAVKVNGRALYRDARRGREVERPYRFVDIFDIKLVEHQGAQVTIEAHVGKGAYIRALVEDIGRAAGTVAVTDSLRRLHVGSYTLKDAIQLEELAELNEATRETKLMEIGSDIPWPVLRISEGTLTALRFGQRPDSTEPCGKYRLEYDGEFKGLAEVERGKIKVIKLTKFNPTLIAISS